MLPDLYYSKSQIEYYNFCQQYEDYFTITRAIRPNLVLFTTFYLWDLINFYWQQYKWKMEAETSISIIWDMFKKFLQKSLKNFRGFVNSYWIKIK